MSSTPFDFYFLIDCNQFFVSCEQLFRPDLIGKPVVVLSSNDGCIVSRSKEAKALGIPMGAPAFKYEALFKQKGVYICSSNFTLYGEMSQRVMATLYQFSSNVEEYSIDEAFLLIETADPLLIAQKMKETILKWTGIPVSIGIGATKTLSKVANDLAKTSPSGIVALRSQQEVEIALKELPVKEIWGIGHQLARKLNSLGIWTALQFIQTEETWLKNQFSISVLQIVLELREMRCFSLDELPAPKQSITRSRSFEKPITALPLLNEALSSHVARAAEKLREQDSCAAALCVFLTTSPFIKNSYTNSAALTLAEPTDYTPVLTLHAKKVLEALYRPGYAYKKVGIVLSAIVPNDDFQSDLFSSPVRNEKKKKAMQVLDELNANFGKKALHFASEGVNTSCKSKRAHMSQSFVAHWDELLTIHL